MGLIKIEISPRTAKGKNENRRTRAAGRIPAVVYGKDRAAEMFELDTKDFGKILKKLQGRAAIFSLIEGEPTDDDSIALLREIQRNPCTDEILHVDLMEVPRGVPVTVAVSVQIVGESDAINAAGAAVAQVMDAVEISCMPRELPEYLEVDISELTEHDKVFAGDIKIPVGELITDPEALVVNINIVQEMVEEVEEEEGEEGEEGADGEASEDDETKED